MDKEIFDELNRIADGFWYENSRYLSGFAFTKDFESALKEFLIVRKWDMKNHDSTFDGILKINPVKDYNDACNAFLKVVTIAKTNDLFIDNEIRKELDDCKNEQEKGKKVLQVKDDMIKQLKDANKDLQKKIDTAVERYPTLKEILYGQNNESEVTEIE
jgi:hypothetical protein